MDVHQCAQCLTGPMQSHKLTIIRIQRYLLSSQYKELVYPVDAVGGLETHVDVNFACGWDPENTDNGSTIYSLTGCVTKYAGCPVYWQSKLQIELVLYTAKAEFITMSQALRDTIPIMSLIKEIDVVFPFHISEPKLVMKVHGDSQSCIAVANNLKFI